MKTILPSLLLRGAFLATVLSPSLSGQEIVDAPTLSIEDPAAVMAAATRLMSAYDRRDWNTFWGMFANDPRVSFPFDKCTEEVIGREAVEARFRAKFALNPPDRRRLAGGGMYLTPLPGDSASVLLSARPMPYEGGFDPDQPGRREFIFVKQDGTWKVARMHVRPYYNPRSDGCR